MTSNDTTMATAVEPKTEIKVEDVKMTDKPADASKTEEKPAAATKTEEKPADAIKTEEKPADVIKTEEKPAEVVEPVKDVELDAPADKRKRVPAHSVAFNSYDATINTLVSTDGILSSFQQAGLGNLLAGIRGNTGVKTGRYYYEAKLVDIIPNHGKQDMRVGFSTSTADLLGGDNTFLFDMAGGAMGTGGTLQGRRALTNDIIGVLLNRDAASEQNNTVSLFMNGKRATEPQAIPEGTGTLFPHVVFKGCGVATNFAKIITPLSFTVRLLGDAAEKDVEKTTVGAPSQQEAVFPIGFDTEEYIKEFVKEHPDFLDLTTKGMRAWAEKSGQKSVACCEDGGKHIGGMMRNRKYIVGMSDALLPDERKALCARFAGYKKTAKVVISSTSRHIAGYANVSLPTVEEGFDVVDFCTPKEEAEKTLESWKADCKLRSRVDDLKVGTFFKEKMAEIRKLVEEKKKDKEEYASLTEEDYLLIILRAEIHYLLHAFKTDVNDEGRPGFACSHLHHYYKLYAQRAFSLPAFGLAKIDDLIELIPEVVTVDSKTLMLPLLEKDIEQTAFFAQADVARINRQDRLDAGDENAALKFSAKTKAERQEAKGPKENKKSKGKGKGKGKGGLHQMTPVKRPAPQHWEQQSFNRR